MKKNEIIDLLSDILEKRSKHAYIEKNYDKFFNIRAETINGYGEAVKVLDNNFKLKEDTENLINDINEHCWNQTHEFIYVVFPYSILELEREKEIGMFVQSGIGLLFIDGDNKFKCLYDALHQFRFNSHVSRNRGEKLKINAPAGLDT